ncbi:hypothetical protein BKA65DRAFT_492224 [Rhexocercosporidium sp. MPI-PUGE-AT-0058]|nr:hypothetical protein BKA65DRAFT_492224 [Rhexocercosporidium sp. MPI-PUGE-AT-0058]
MPSKNLTPEGQRRKLFNQRMPTVEKKMNELVDVCKAEVALFILPHDDDEMWVFKSRLNFPSVNRATTIDLHTPEDWLGRLQRQTRTFDTSNQQAIAGILPSAMDLDGLDDVVDHSEINNGHTERPPAVQVPMDTAHAQQRHLAEQQHEALTFGHGTSNGEGTTLPSEGSQPAALQYAAEPLGPPKKPSRPSSLRLSNTLQTVANTSPPLFVSPTTPVRRRPGLSRRRANAGITRSRRHKF